MATVTPYNADAVLDVDPAYQYDEEFNEQSSSFGRLTNKNKSTKSPYSFECRKIVILLGVAALVTAVVTTTVVIVDRSNQTSSKSDTSSSSLFDPQENASGESVGDEARDNDLFGSGFEIMGVDKDNEHDMNGHDIDPVDIQFEAGAQGDGEFFGEIVTGQDIGNGNGNGNGQKNGHKKQKHVDDNIMDDNGGAGADDDEPVNCACVTKDGKNDRGRQQIKNVFGSNNGKRKGRNLMNTDDVVTLSNGNVVVYGVTTTKRKMKDLKEHKWKDKQNKSAEFECDETIEFQSVEPCDTEEPPPECFEDEERRLGADEDKPRHDSDENHKDQDDRRRLGVYAGQPWHYHLGQGGGIGMKREIYKALVMSGVYDTKFQPTAANDPGDIWRVVSEGSKEVTVCIVDSGYDYDHPDLPKEPQVSGDDYGARLWKHDGTGHGTQIAGIIAAQPNNKIDSGSDKYVEGVAPNIKLHIVRAFDDYGSGNTNDLIYTLNQCRAKGVDIINLSVSYGTTNFGPITELLTDMYENDGIITFAAAGNVITAYPRGSLIHPAAIPSVVSVTGISNGYTFHSYSNWNEQVELSARGNAIPTTSATGGYMSAFGTSFSTSFGSGVAALLLSNFKGVCTPQQVRSCMSKMARVCNTGLSSSKLPQCEVCNGVDLTTGLKTCPNQDSSTNPCPEGATLSTCGNSFSPPASCDPAKGTCCDDHLSGGNGWGHGAIQAKAAHDALSQDCDCGTPRIQSTTSNICDSPCSSDGTCDDGVECTTDCKTQSNVCVNIPNDFGAACGDINECSNESDNCHAAATCTNIPGGFTCLCSPGFAGNGVTCLDINECLSGNGGCDPLTQCINTIGSRTCSACPAGYGGTGEDGCYNLDECGLGTHNCHANATCTDTEGSFSCSCNSGFGGDGVICTVAPTNFPSSSPSTAPTPVPSGKPSGAPTPGPSPTPSSTPSSSIPQFIENRSPAQSAGYTYQGPKQYEQGITSHEDSCVTLKVMNDNTSDQRCKHLSYDFDLICPSEKNKSDGENTKFRLFSTLTCAASSGPFGIYGPGDDWHIHAKWRKNNGDIKDWDDRRKCTDDSNGKSLKDLGCSKNADGIPVATVEVWFYAAEVDTEPNNWEDADHSTEGYCYFEYEMKCQCGDCD